MWVMFYSKNVLSHEVVIRLTFTPENQKCWFPSASLCNMAQLSIYQILYPLSDAKPYWYFKSFFFGDPVYSDHQFI